MTSPEFSIPSHSDRKLSAKLSKGDAATLEALQTAVHLEICGSALTIQSGGGPFQAIRVAAPDISGQGAAALAHLINLDTGKIEYVHGEHLHMPKDAEAKLNLAELRKLLHLPLNAPDAEVDKRLEAERIARSGQTYNPHARVQRFNPDEP